MNQIARLTVEIEFDGDFCAECVFLQGHECTIFGNTLRKKWWSPLEAYLEDPFESTEEHVRCSQCRNHAPAAGANRVPKKGMVIFPTAKQLYKGTKVPCEKIVDLAKVLPGHEISALYGFHEDDEDVSAKITLYPPKGSEIPCGTTTELRLQKVPEKAREALLSWAFSLQDDVLDQEGTLMWKWFNGKSK